MSEREITEPVDLCTPDGRLDREAVGWSRRPLHRCALPGSWGRRKRWDYWCVTGPGFALSMTYADVDYLGTADVWFHDFASGRTFAKGGFAPLARGMAMPDAVAGGDLRHGGIAITEEAGGTRLAACFDGFWCDVLCERPAGHESLTVVIPWSDRRFQLTNKDPARPASGVVRWGDDEWAVGEGSWGCLDFGRGKWPYSTRWNWGSASGDGVALQLGGRWTVGTGMTENAVLVDGRLSKLSEELVWEYDTSDWLRPWRIASERVDLTFTPVYDKVTRMQLGVASSSVDQCFGTYSGTVVADGGEVRVDDLFGWAEDAAWRW